MIQVSSAYRRWFTDDLVFGIWTPSSFLVASVSESVAITVRKMTTLKGSPCSTPISRGITGETQSGVEIVAVRPVYQD